MIIISMHTKGILKKKTLLATRDHFCTSMLHTTIGLEGEYEYIIWWSQSVILLWQRMNI
jgi:hypothetical protein